ncbi:MAG: alpha/beta fold hydrolase [Bdellovibrionota bacterium]
MIEESRIETEPGVHLHVVTAGPKSGRPLIFLHGFPEFWFGWDAQIEHFARAGYRVIAPDQRGYNLSDKPAGLSGYRLSRLAADIIAMMDRLGIARALLVGHDWGGAVSWFLASKYPERFEKLAILNMPHLAVFRKHLRSNPRQRKRSRYIAFFQIPWLPEFLLSAGRLTRTLTATSRVGTFSEGALARYHEAWKQPGAVRGMVNWYRAVRLETEAVGRIRVPTLVLWGMKDRFLGAEMAEESVAQCENGRLERLEGATHWVQHEEPARVNELLGGFFG